MEFEGVRIDYTGHSGFIFSFEGKRIAIDPYNLSQNLEKVDCVLITHGHYDHCSIKDIKSVIKNNGMVIVPADAQSKVTKIEDVEMQVVEVGDKLDFGKFKIEVVPAYNVDKDFHTKADGFVGYILKIDKVVIYHAGDSDKIPEMQKLTGYGKHGNKFVVLLPVSGKYVMNPEEASEVASLLNADLAIPMHYGAEVGGSVKDAQKFLELCINKGVNVKILEKI